MTYLRTDDCRSCHAACIWLIAKTGRAMLVDRDSVTDEDTLQGRNVEFKPALGHRAHWASCPDAEKWRAGKLSRTGRSGRR